ncbi:MerR family DNA-binding protein [Streptomyces vastus]|uniref:Transcription regulator MerR DNA binding domain-containing protein n=1 Tax=Streptomyces vastus TaxID=285451 RepID=A0ABP6CGV2_9ACTN
MLLLRRMVSEGRDDVDCGEHPGHTSFFVQHREGVSFGVCHVVGCVTHGLLRVDARRSVARQEFVHAQAGQRSGGCRAGDRHVGPVQQAGTATMALRDAGASPCAQVAALIERHLADIERHLAELRQTRTALRALAERAAATDPAECTDTDICRILAGTNSERPY